MNTKQTYVLSIGISRYQYLRPLSCAANDAQDLSELLSHSADPIDVKLLLDDDATKPAVLREFAWLANSAGSEDTAIVFFSGHGGRTALEENNEACFCTVETSSSAIRQTSLTSDELTAALRAVKAKRLVVLIDACYSGGLGEPRSRSASLTMALTAKDVNSLLEGEGRVIIAASRPDELAWEVTQMRNGVFTHYLLGGLRGEVAHADGTIWVSELFGYISRNVRLHGKQHPYQKAVGEDFVVVVQRGTENVEALTSHLELDQRSLRRMMHRAYSRSELSLLCKDLGFTLDDLEGTTLETQLMELIDHCDRHGLNEQLLALIRADRPQLTLAI